MDAIIADLLTIADEVLPPTNVDLEQYWMRFLRQDGAGVTLVVDLQNQTASIIVNTGSMALGIGLRPYGSLRILDRERRVIEVTGTLRGTPCVRCVIAVEAETVVDVVAGDTVASEM